MNKITKEFLESEIQEVKYTQMNDRLTHCLIVTKSGFLFSGESVVVDAANFDKNLGENMLMTKHLIVCVNRMVSGYIKN